MAYDIVIGFKYLYSKMRGALKMDQKMEDLDINSIVEKVREVIASWKQEDQDSFFKLGYDDRDLISLHHSFGRWIRNNYGLWKYTHTAELEDGVDYSPFHPDAISMKIIKEAWLRGPIKK